MIFFEYIQNQIILLEPIRPNGQHAKNEKKQKLKSYKKQLAEEQKEIKDHQKLRGKYVIKIQTENKGTHSWPIFYDSVLYVNKIINEDHWKTYRGGVARDFCKIYKEKLRPWKNINNMKVKQFDEVTL